MAVVEASVLADAAAVVTLAGPRVLGRAVSIVPVSPGHKEVADRVPLRHLRRERRAGLLSQHFVFLSEDICRSLCTGRWECDLIALGSIGRTGRLSACSPGRSLQVRMNFQPVPVELDALALTVVQVFEFVYSAVVVALAGPRALGRAVSTTPVSLGHKEVAGRTLLRHLHRERREGVVGPHEARRWEKDRGRRDPSAVRGEAGRQQE